MSLKLNTWTTIDDEGNFVPFGVGELKTTSVGLQEIEKNTDYKFSTPQKVTGVVNTVKNDAKSVVNAVSSTTSGIGDYIKYIPFALMGGIVLLLIGRK